jgi:PHR domain.
VFYFKSSKKSNNGTDVNAGQIPQMLYRVVTPENQTPNRQTDQSEPVYILSRDFSRAVSRVSRNLNFFSYTLLLAQLCNNLESCRVVHLVV